MYTANGKRQIQVRISQSRKWADKTISKRFLWTKQNIMHETNGLCVEIGAS